MFWSSFPFSKVLLQSVDPIAFGSVEKQDVMVAWTAHFMVAGSTESNEKDTLHWLNFLPLGPTFFRLLPPSHGTGWILREPSGSVQLLLTHIS